MSNENIIDVLAKKLIEAKVAENLAKENRIAIENKLIANSKKVYGKSVTTKGDEYTVTVKSNVVKKINDKNLNDVYDTLSDDVKCAFVKTWKLNTKVYKSLSDSDLLSLVDVIDVKENKAGVSVSRIN